MGNTDVADKKEVTVEDLRMVKYFWEEKERLEAWSGYADKLPALQREHPELMAAYEKFKKAKRDLDAEVRSLDLYPD